MKIVASAVVVCALFCILSVCNLPTRQLLHAQDFSQRVDAFSSPLASSSSLVSAQLEPPLTGESGDPTAIDLLGSPSKEDEATLQRAQEVASSIAATDWLGALSPIALSPFFGMACLTGVATYGPEWLRERSSLFADSGPLANPYLFWAMAVLTVVTSLPRLSKVSKPIALIADRLESYSVILILVCIRLFGNLSTEAEVPVATLPFAVAGVTDVPLDILLALFAWLNLLVVGTIKLFFEFLIWLTPIPTLDAIFEAGNKATSAALTSLYCFSPFAAAAVDLMLLFACSLVFFWVSRRVHYCLHVLILPWLYKLFGWRKEFDYSQEPMFLATAWKSWPVYTRVKLYGSESDGWMLKAKRFIFFVRTERLRPSKLVVEEELLRRRARLHDGEETPLELFLRK